MIRVDVQEAETRLTELLLRSERGEDVVIVRAGQPVAHPVPLEQAPPRRFGLMRLDVPDDFDDPVVADEPQLPGSPTNR